MENKKILEIFYNIMSHLNMYNLLSEIKYFFLKPVARVSNRQEERIESMRFTVPALRVGVLEYGPGQLQTGNKELDGKAIRLYYPPEAVSDKKFIKSLETAPVVVGGHDSTTNEKNKKIDGWASAVKYDKEANAAIIDGIVKGNKQINFIKNNIGINDFGASAFIDIYGLKVQDGITPDGKPYDAIATDLRATHVALAEHVRDPENKIKVVNAVVINSHGAIKQEGIKMDGMTPETIATIVQNAVEKAVTAKNEGDRLDKIEKAIVALVKNQEEMKEEMKEKKEEEKEAEAGNKKGKAKNEDEEDEEEDEDEEAATLENAKPSQEIVGAFAKAFNVNFGTKTPSFSTLATLAGIKEEDSALRIAAVNAKYVEINEKKVTAENSKSGKMEVF